MVHFWLYFFVFSACLSLSMTNDVVFSFVQSLYLWLGMVNGLGLFLALFIVTLLLCYLPFMSYDRLLCISCSNPYFDSVNHWYDILNCCVRCSS